MHQDCQQGENEAGEGEERVVQLGVLGDGGCGGGSQTRESLVFDKAKPTFWT